MLRTRSRSTRRRSAVLTAAGMLLGLSGLMPVAVRAQTALPSGLRFGPATVVDPTFFGPEPQVTTERPAPGAVPGALDPSRLFVDNPTLSTAGLSLLHRSKDGGASFRVVFNPDCAAMTRRLRVRPG